MSREVDFAAKPIDPDFMNKPDEYPETGTHFDHKVFAVDFDGCVADGVCMDVCPVDVFEWLLAPGKKGTGNDKIIEKGGEEWDKYRCDKSDMIRESDCIDCMACETACPTKVIKINP